VNARSIMVAGVTKRFLRRPWPAVRRAGLAAALAVACAAGAATDRARAVDEAKRRWADSPHGPMLERILPPYFEVSQLPQADSRGADLMVQYCVQCHNLPNPAMHDADKWPKVVDRMVVRMHGHGNMGELMRDMMAGVRAPTEDETQALIAYLQDNALRPIDPGRYPDIDSDAAKSFRLACGQCHALPDPKRHTAREWQSVVSRMERNMLWMNRVVGSRADPREPQLRVDEIVGYLKRHARGL
jgi:cytochrome c5